MLAFSKNSDFFFWTFLVTLKENEKKCQTCKQLRSHWELTTQFNEPLQRQNWTKNCVKSLFCIIWFIFTTCEFHREASKILNWEKTKILLLILEKTQKWVECIWRTLGVPESSLVSNVKLFWRIEVNFFQPVSLEPQEELFSSTRSSTLNMGMYSYDPSTGTPEYHINFTTLLGSGIWMVEPFHETWMNYYFCSGNAYVDLG